MQYNYFVQVKWFLSVKLIYFFSTETDTCTVGAFERPERFNLKINISFNLYPELFMTGTKLFFSSRI